MLGYLSDSSSVGIYNASSKVSILAGSVLNSLTAIFSPIISDLHNKKKMELLGSLYSSVTKWTLTLTIPITIIFIFFADNILLIFGDEFTKGMLVLIILSSARLVISGFGPVGYMLQMSGKQLLVLINTLFMLLVNIILNYWLIRHYGIMGAALGTFFALTLVNLVEFIQVKYLMNLQPYSLKFIKPLIAGASASLVIILSSKLDMFQVSWFILLFASLVSYFAFIWIMGFDEEDKMIISTIRRKIRI
jgi:O-antigen/teichoic acid export membrane protein